MRTYTIVPSFQGESAYFDLPDLGFQGDHLSFAILFNLTELIEHWPNIVPSMIVTDPKGNTYIAPHTSWDSEKHIFTWAISSTETTYEGVLRCQLKCVAADDPDTIVCMSRICQSRVYQSLDAASDPPEAFQAWIDALVELGADINADASVVLEGVRTTQTNALAAQAAADDAETYKNAAQQFKNQTSQDAQTAVDAKDAAVLAQQRAQNAATDAESAKNDAVTAKNSAVSALEQTDIQAAAAALSSQSAASDAARAQTAKNDTNALKLAAEAARDAAVVAQGRAERAQTAAETASDEASSANRAATAAQAAAEAAQIAAETAQGAAEDAQSIAEAAADDAEDFSESSKKWAIGKDRNNQNVPSSDSTFENSSQYWAYQSEASAGQSQRFMEYVRDFQVTSVSYSDNDESLTFTFGSNPVNY